MAWHSHRIEIWLKPFTRTLHIFHQPPACHNRQTLLFLSYFGPLQTIYVQENYESLRGKQNTLRPWIPGRPSHFRVLFYDADSATLWLSSEDRCLPIDIKLCLDPKKSFPWLREVGTQVEVIGHLEQPNETVNIQLIAALRPAQYDQL